MRPRRPPAQAPDGPFKTALERFIDMALPLVRVGAEARQAGLGRRDALPFRPNSVSRTEHQV